MENKTIKKRLSGLFENIASVPEKMVGLAEEKREQAINDDADLKNISGDVKQQILQGKGYQVPMGGMKRVPGNKTLPYEGEVAPTSESNSDSQAGYARALDAIKQRSQAKNQGMSAQQSQALLKQKALEDMQNGIDYKKLSDEFSGNPQPVQPEESREEKMYRAMYGKPMPKDGQ